MEQRLADEIIQAEESVVGVMLVRSLHTRTYELAAFGQDISQPLFVATISMEKCGRQSGDVCPTMKDACYVLTKSESFGANERAR
jgi:hypothetical protein